MQYNDQGYGIHFSNYTTTLGCIKIGSQPEANQLAALSDQALLSEDGRSTLTVMDPGKKNK